jgi:hypothetical protein
MLYNGTTIQNLMGLVGWQEAVPPTSILVTSANTASTSGRFFSSFHQSAIVENVFATLPNAQMDNDTLNALLLKMKKDSVLEVLSRIYDANPLAYRSSQEIDGKVVTSLNYALEYDTLTANNMSVFADPIGFNMAKRCLQLYVTSTRSNRLQAIQEMKYPELKAELDGIYSENGKMVAKGANYFYEEAIKRTIEILFPTIVKSEKVITGIHPW